MNNGIDHRGKVQGITEELTETCFDILEFLNQVKACNNGEYSKIDWNHLYQDVIPYTRYLTEALEELAYHIEQDKKSERERKVRT